MNKITYNGNHVFNISFGLYGFDEIDFEESQKEIKLNFEKEKLKGLKTALNDLGLKFCELKWFSPREYNFDTDSLDLVIEVKNKEIFKKAIEQNKETINKNLSKNKSYDGYMALTSYDYDYEIEKLNKDNYEPDTLVLSTLLNIYYPELSDFEIIDYLIYEDTEE
jgi:hypothetical protein